MKAFVGFVALSCLLGVALCQSPARAPAATAAVSEADVLTFAYNLECLEGQFYSCAAFGTPLPTSITGGGPAPSSCTKANLSASVGTYAAELAREEQAHVAFLYSALTSAGATPVCPSVNIDTAFESAARAAFMTTSPLNPTFNPYANDVFFLHGSFIFEDLGASAYLGGLGLLTTPTYRQAAAQIGNTESYHSAVVRTLLYQQLTTTPAYNSTVLQITNAIVSALNSLSGSPQLKYNLQNNQGSSLANVDAMAFVPVATPAQILKVVTLNAPAGQGGGFFPNNLVGGVKN